MDSGELVVRLLRVEPYLERTGTLPPFHGSNGPVRFETSWCLDVWGRCDGAGVVRAGAMRWWCCESQLRTAEEGFGRGNSRLEHGVASIGLCRLNGERPFEPVTLAWSSSCLDFGVCRVMSQPDVAEALRASAGTALQQRAAFQQLRSLLPRRRPPT